MTTLKEFRRKYPQYDDMSDERLSDALYRKHYSDMPRAEFDKKIGYAPPSLGRQALDTARIVGTGAVQGVAEVGDMAKAVMGPPPRMPPALEQAMRGGPVGRVLGENRAGLGGTGLAERVGLPSNAAKEAERLGLEMTPLRQALTSGARVGTSAAMMGAGTIPSAMAAVGAGTGRAVGGETGELVGSIALPLTGLAATRAFGPRGTKPPTAETLKADAAALYKRGDDAGTILSGKFWDRAVSGIERRLAKEAYHPAAHPQTKAALDVLDGARGQHITWKGVDVLRDTVRDLAGAAKTGKDRRLVKIMTDRLNDYLRRAPSGAVVQGNLPLSRESYRAADVMWSRAKKSDAITDLLRNAELKAPNFAASGYENAIRTEFRRLSLNAKEMRRFSAAERKAIEDIAKGGNVLNILRNLGRAAPAGAMMKGFYGAGMGASAATMNPLLLALTAGTAGVTSAARLGARGMQARNARLVAEMMRRGGPAPPRATKAVEDYLKRSLLFGPAAASVGN